MCSEDNDFEGMVVDRRKNKGKSQHSGEIFCAALVLQMHFQAMMI